VLGLVGAGRTGRVVAELAAERGIELAWVARRGAGGVEALDDASFGRPGVVVEFSTPGAAERTLERCLELGVPAVSATTGWEERRAELVERFRRRGGALVYGDNFSLGVHVFLRAAEAAARGLGGVPEYDAYVQEAHHRAKADAPSGTARALVRRILPHLSSKRRSVLATAGRDPIPADALSVAVTRAGSIPGTHVLAFDGPHDTLTLTHTARSNRGFAAGALLAAGWIAGRRGVWSVTEMFDLITQEGGTP
jgi:4-hydroxy-tetrahydrodipicolinate reductase